MVKASTRFLFFLISFLTLLHSIVFATINLGGDLSAGNILFEDNLNSPPGTNFTVSGFTQSSPGTELRLTPTQTNWGAQLLVNNTLYRREGLTFEGSVFIPHGNYKAVMVGFHDGVTNNTEGIQHGLYFFDNGGGIAIQARSGSNANHMPTRDYDNTDISGSWFDFQIVIHRLGATYRVKRSSEVSYTNVLTFDGGNNPSELKIGVQANKTNSATNNYTAHKNWKVYQPNTLYVNKNVVGGNGSGDSWTNAISELADALKWAKENEAYWTSTNPLRIWVASGTYKPLYSASDGSFGVNDGRNNTFLLVKNVQVYGGFAGAEHTLGSRDLSIKTNATILSGDINDDDVVSGNGSTLSFSNNGENILHVVLASGNVANALLDGFTIQGGNANQTGFITVGGMRIYKSRGAGAYCRMASPTFNHVLVTSHSANDYGGAVYNDDSSFSTFINALITKSRSANGGGMGNHTLSNPVLSAVTISGNYATNSGGGIYSADSSPQVSNTIIALNEAITGAEVHNDSGVGPSFTYSLVLGSGGSSAWNSGIGTDGGHNIDANPVFFDDIGNFTPKSTSPVINQGFNQSYLDIGDNSAIDVDLAGRSRFFNTTMDMGAYEFYPQQPKLSAFADITKVIGDGDFVISAPVSESDGTFSYTSSNTSVATVAGNIVTIVGVGSTNIIATQASTANYKEGSIELKLTVENVLPVELASFTVKVEGERAKLTWRTLSEKDNAMFLVLRSGTNGGFSLIGEIAGAAKNSDPARSYTFYDHKPMPGLNYYKLIQVDENGKETELALKSLTLKIQDVAVKVYPNPTSDLATIVFPSQKFSRLLLVDGQGKALQQWKIQPNENFKTFSITSRPRGLYLLKLIGPKDIEGQKILKE